MEGGISRCPIRTMIDDDIGILAHPAAMTLVPRLGTTGLGLLPTLLAVRRGRLRRGARSLLRALQPQHQLDQLFAAQPLKIAPAHPTRESAKSDPRKGVGNYAHPAEAEITGNTTVGRSRLSAGQHDPRALSQGLADIAAADEPRQARALVLSRMERSRFGTTGHRSPPCGHPPHVGASSKSATELLTQITRIIRSDINIK